MKTAREKTLSSYKIVTGILCVGPLLLWLISEVQSLVSELEVPRGGLFQTIDLFLGVLGYFTEIAALIGLIIAVFFAIRTYRGIGVPKNRRILWTYLLVCGNIIVLPFFWYFNIYKNEASVNN